MTVECSDCGETFESESGRSTHRTWKHDDSSKVTLTCKECGDEFEMCESRLVNEHRNCERNFCSRECYDEWQTHARRGQKGTNWQGGKAEYTCDECGKNFLAYDSRKPGERSFCSWVCWAEANGKSRGESV